MARHRHAVNVRADGLTAVLGPLADDPAVLAALLLDIDSGMVLGAAGHPMGSDLEELGAVHGELMRLACADAVGAGAADQAELDTEVAVSRGVRRHLVVRRIADPYGDRLALSVLVDGPPRVLRRVRRRLGEVSTAALTAGPTVSLRPREGAWVPGTVEERPVLRSPSRTQPITRVPVSAPSVADVAGGVAGGAAVDRRPVSRPASPGILAAAALAELTAPSALRPPGPAIGQASGPVIGPVISRSTGSSIAPARPAPPVPGAARLQAVPPLSRPDDQERRPAPPSALPPSAQPPPGR